MPVPAVEAIASACVDQVAGFVDDAERPVIVIGRFVLVWRTKRRCDFISAGRSPALWPVGGLEDGSSTRSSERLCAAVAAKRRTPRTRSSSWSDSTR